MTITGSTVAIVLAGGRASRMGGVDKPALVVGGRRMLDTALAAVSACARVVVVGPQRPELPEHVLQTRESPPGGGPVAAVAAGFEALGAADHDTVVVLAADLPFLDVGVVDALIRGARGGAAFAVDETEQVQYLCSAWAASVLGARLGASVPHVNRPMKVLVPENYSRVTTRGAVDCDTARDLEHARSHNRHEAVSLDEARTAVLRETTPLSPHRNPLEESVGAALSEQLIAAQACPGLDVSAMDGYAVSGGTLGPWRLRTETRFAGSANVFELEEGEAVRIATGAHLPDGATTVVRDEHADVDGDVLRRRVGTPVRDDVRRRGEDWAAGFVVAEAGTAVTPALISAAASAEVTTGTVRGPVRAHVVITGDEIRRTGPLHTGQTRDSLGPILPMLLSHCGVHRHTEAHLRDTSEGFEQVLREVTDTDVIVIVGATGGGAADQLRRALDDVGARVVVGRVAIRPGGSQVAAVLPDGRVVLGLPGNPYAAVATLLTMLPTIVTAFTGSTPRPRTVGDVVNADEVRTDVTRILPATRLLDGRWKVEPSVRTAHLAGLVGRDALAVVPVDPAARTELLPLP